MFLFLYTKLFQKKGTLFKEIRQTRAKKSSNYCTSIVIQLSLTILKINLNNNFFLIPIYIFFFLAGKVTTLEALAERESIYKLLPQCTPENTSKDFSSYTTDPKTRYPHFNGKLLSPHQVTNLYDTGKKTLCNVVKVFLYSHYFCFNICDFDNSVND